MAGKSMEERVAALETELLRLKQLVEPEKAVSWVEKWAGAFLNDPYFEKAMKYGRQYRESLRPRKPRKRKKKNGDP
ncbi:MAG TPA: hypothetical protein VN688_29430 [Gemmataceae bacterium]|nr:hypothetical protein [Gemmataceae bacterium]